MKFDNTPITTAYHFNFISEERLNEIENMNKETLCDLRQDCVLKLKTDVKT